MNRAATIISTAFHYVFLGMAGIILILTKYPITATPWNTLYPLAVLILNFIIPSVILFTLKHEGLVSDYDVSKREQRAKVTLFGSLSFILYVVLTFLVEVPAVYKQCALFSVLFLIIFGFITLYWKISYHMGVIGWFTSLLILIYGLNFFTFVVALFMSVSTGISRVILRRHTVSQVIAGYGVSVLVFLLALTIFH